MSDYEFSWILRPLNGIVILPRVRDQGRRPSCVFHASCLAAEIERRRAFALLQPPRSTDFTYDVPSFIADYENNIGRRLGDRYDRGFDYAPARVFSACHLVLHFGVTAHCGGGSVRERLQSVEAHGLLPFREVAELIYQGRPVIGGFTTNRLFDQLGRNEIYSYVDMPNYQPVGHMVVFVGHGMRGGREYLVFMNSAGDRFGQNGFGRVWFDEVRDYHTVQIQGQTLVNRTLHHGRGESFGAASTGAASSSRGLSSFYGAAAASTSYGASSSSSQTSPGHTAQLGAFGHGLSQWRPDYQAQPGYGYPERDLLPPHNLPHSQLYGGYPQHPTSSRSMGWNQGPPSLSSQQGGGYDYNMQRSRPYEGHPSSYPPGPGYGLPQAPGHSSSHIVHVSPGENALSDVLISTPIFTGEEGGSGFAASAAAAGATGATGYDFGVDPNVDPELALALRLSMEEERARQEAIAKKAAEESSGADKDHASSSTTDSIMAEAEATLNAPSDEKNVPLKDDNEAELLQQALAMSMDEGSTGAAAVADAAMAEAAADDQDLELALQMSVQESSQSDMSKVFNDRSFMTSILNSLPGVDPNDQSVQDLLATLHGQGEQEEKGDKSDKTDKPEDGKN